MTSLTIPRMPRLGRGRTIPSVSTAEAPKDSLDQALSDEGAASRIGAEVTVTEQRLRMRRMATIIAGSLIVAAIASGAATVVARQVARRRSARGSATVG